MIGDKRDESFTTGYQAGFAQAIVAAATRAQLADSTQAAAVAIRELDLAAHDQESREDHVFTAGYDEGQRALRKLMAKLPHRFIGGRWKHFGPQHERHDPECPTCAIAALATPERGK